MGAEPPKDHAELVLRVILDRQAAQHHKTASVGDLMADLVDRRPQGGNDEMLELQIVEAEASGFYLPHCALDVAELRRGEVDRVIRWRPEIADLPGAGMIDRRRVYGRRRQGRVGVGFAADFTNF